MWAIHLEGAQTVLPFKHIVFAIARLESTRAQEALNRFGSRRARGRRCRHYTELGPDWLFHSVDEAVRALGGQTPT
jgi:hypothetical protein